ncbi:Hypothetical protein CM240_2899 [Clostridium bornimense]|uniref:DNA methylase adenine-specific domain-containing protein n=1 Tax=Clostridium bornimense TaxID=1216932 RepID=W6RZE0_9CLOT|nr:N-6 DNA methylase [Clostridium bornimense]CDM70016.1 Hypothetical protein CM240_2899 [Clostridium bornimense]
MNFPTELQTSETADLFVTLILYRLKKNGKVGIILPDNFLFGTENSQKILKERLLTECTLTVDELKALKELLNNMDI